MPIPPILPILKYYENINASLTNIKNSVQELMINSINEVFTRKNETELDTILNDFRIFKSNFFSLSQERILLSALLNF